MKTYKISMGFHGIFISFLILCASFTFAAPPDGKGKNKDTGDSGDNTTDVFTPLKIVNEQYNFRYSTRTYCIGEDDMVYWEAKGDLKPGESFSFTNKYPACQYHSAIVFANANWSGSTLEIKSHLPATQANHWGEDHKGKLVKGTNLGETSQLCMFPSYNDETEHNYYTITVTNVGNEIAKNIQIKGENKNEWSYSYYDHCLNADADNDGWNDSLEYSLEHQMSGMGYIDGILQPYIMWGSDYMSGQNATSTPDDELDTYPIDFNDDGVIDDLDVSRITSLLGEGNGVPLEQISPNPGDGKYYYWSNHRLFRRFDIEGDGFVDQKDVDIVKAHIGHPVPMLSDIINPTAKVLFPGSSDTVTRGSSVNIRGHVWDNKSIAKVEYLVNNKVICTATDPVATFSFAPHSPFYSCWWEVPNGKGEYNLSIRVTDGSGRVGFSEAVHIVPQR